MPDAGSSPWWVVAIGALPTLGAGVWVVIKYFRDSADKQKEGSLSREERLIRDLDAQRAGAAKEAAELLIRYKEELARKDAELERKDQRIDSLETDNDKLQIGIDRWADIARGWKARAHELKHKLSNTQIALNGFAPRRRIWPDETLPPIEEIGANNVLYFARDNRAVYENPDS